MNHENGANVSPTLPEAKAPGIAPPAPAGKHASRLPGARIGNRRRAALAVGGVMLALTVVAFGLWWRGSLFAQAPFTGPTWTVRKEKVKITIVARGTLESASNKDIVCTVRSGTKGSTSATMIKEVVDEGTEVKKGDKVIVLDSSGLQEQLKDQNIKVDNAYALMIAAVEECSIQESKNVSDIESAKNVLALAKLEKAKYEEGDYVAALKDIQGKMETAKSDLEDWKDRAAWSARMVKKGLMSKVQADADKSRSEASRISLGKLEEDERVLVKYTKQREVQDRTAKLAEAERALTRTELQAASLMKQKNADKKAKESIHLQELARKKEIEAEIAKCVIYSPQDGLVVYYVPEQVRGGGGSQQSIIAPGEPVREGQKMIQIPDLSRMLVNVKVPEAFVSHLHNPTPGKKGFRQKAQIRVDSYSKQTLHGTIQLVATVASSADWFASDVKNYKTMIAIDESLPGLKPGMSAEVTIFADESSEPVLVVPVQAVLGAISMGAERKCFVVDARGRPELRDIVVGMSNERLVEVKSGLKEGDHVVLNPQPLLKEDSELKAGKPRGKEKEGGPGEGGKGKQGGKGGPPAGAGGPGGPGPGPGGKGPGAKGPGAKGKAPGGPPGGL
jgi:HlyD family secretion protein